MDCNKWPVARIVGKQGSVLRLGSRRQESGQEMTGQATDTRRRPWLRHPLFWVTASFLLLVLVVVTFVIVMYNRAVHSNEVQRERQREAIAAFVAPPGWEEHPGRFGEFNDTPCLILSLCKLHHSRVWTAADPQPGTALSAVAEASGWEEIRFSAESHEPEACRQEGEGSFWCPLHAVSGKVSFELHTWLDRNAEGLWWIRLKAY